jgi:hypothetical protein
MSRKTWVEVLCDDCGCAEHFPAPASDAWLEKEGYRVVSDKHYCGKCEEVAESMYGPSGNTAGNSGNERKENK